MFEKYTETAMKAIWLMADNESKDTGQKFVGTEHLLIGLIGLVKIEVSVLLLGGEAYRP